MFPYNPYVFIKTTSLNNVDTTELSRTERRASLRRKLDTLSLLSELTADVDRMLVRHATTPPATCAEFLTAIREQAALIAHFDDVLKRTLCSVVIDLPKVAARARVVLTGAQRFQGQPGGRTAMPPEPLEHMGRYLAEMTALLDGLPSSILEYVKDTGDEARCRRYHFSDTDLHVPETLFDAIDFLERLQCCREGLAASAASDDAGQRLDELEARQQQHLDDPDALEPLRKALVDIHQAMCQAYLRQQPEEAPEPLVERVSRDRQQRVHDIAAAIESRRQLLAQMEAFSAAHRA